MSTTRFVNGQPYLIPDQGDTYVWGTDLSNWIGAVSNSTLQKNGGPFTLSADVDFGPTGGLKTVFLSARTSPADSGFLRLGNTDAVKWRNAANSGNNTLSMSGDVLTYSGTFAASSFNGITSTMVGLGNVDNTSDANKPVSTAQATAITAAAPPGAVMYFAGSTAPAGWLVRDGSAISRTTYAALFAAVGTTYGIGNGSTTFNLPDDRGNFIRGWDNGRGVDPSRIFGTEQSDAFRSHTHEVPVTGSLGSNGTARFTYLGNDGAQVLITGVTSGGGGPETRPRNRAYLPIIKY